MLATWSGLAGGSGRNMLDLVEALDPPPVVCVPEGPVGAGARERGAPVLTIPERSLVLRGGLREPAAAAARVVGHALELRRLAIELEPDLVVAWGMRTLLAASLGVRGVPVLFAHQDLLPAGSPGHAVRLAARRAGQAVCASDAIAADLDPRRRISDLRTVHHGVDLDRFRPEGPPRPQQVLTLGAIIGWKRPDLALEVMAGVRRLLPEARLRLVGPVMEGEGARIHEQLRARTQEPDLAGGVDLVGEIADPLPELQRAACLLHCADREPYGRAIAEALACGTPVVAVEGGGPAEMVDGSSGRLYPAGDYYAAARALVEIIGDEHRRQELARGAREHAESALGAERTRSGLNGAAKAAARARPAAGDASRKATVVIVSHDSEDELAALLASLARHLPRSAVVVVDSGSSDGSADVARGWRGQARVLELGDVGFGRAVNAGLDEVDRPVTIVANPDLELVDDSIGGLIEEVERHDRLVAPVLLRADGSRQDSVHPRPTSAPDLVRALVPPGLLPRRLAEPLAPHRARRSRKVGWAVGACLAVRTETLRRLGGFDESIFLYGEDLELGLRAHESGVETWFRPSARVLHHEGHSTTPTFGGEAFALLAAQRRSVVRRRMGRGGAIVDTAAQAVTFLDRLLIKSLAGMPTARERRQLAAVLRGKRIYPEL